MRPDDDALDWGDGTADPTYVDGGRRADAAASVSSASDMTGTAAVAASGADRADTDPSGPAMLASVLLVAYGILAGVYALSVVGWISALPLDTYSSSILAFEILYQFGQFLAIASPVLWFAAVFLLTRPQSVRRVVALAVGIPVVAPWPLIVASLA